MSLFDFRRRFGKAISAGELQGKFVILINHHLIARLDEETFAHRDYRPGSYPFFDAICLGLNREPLEFFRNHARRAGISRIDLRPPSLRVLTGGRFEETLALVEVVHSVSGRARDPGEASWRKLIDRLVPDILDGAPPLLGVAWRDGKFYPQGADDLEAKLISEPLQWLRDIPKVRALLRNALDQYAESLRLDIRRKDVVGNAYQAVEEMAREIVGNQKSFESNMGPFIDALGLDKQWGNIVHSYKELSKEFGRHSGRDDFIPTQAQTEGFLYLSGLLLRLACQRTAKGPEGKTESK